MKTTLQLLTQGLELIRDPKHWAQGALAFTGHHTRLSNPSSQLACSWCSMGALMKVGNAHPKDGPDFFAQQALLTAMDELGFNYPTVARFNDSESHGNVIKVWEKAIENNSSNP